MTNALVESGASNEMEFRLVPTNAATVSTAAYFNPLPAAARHVRDVDEAHDMVGHAVPPRLAEGVKSATMKFNPTTVTEVPPDETMLGRVA